MRTPLFKRIAIGCIVVLLLLVGYFWTQQVSVTSPSLVGQSQPTATTVIAPDTSSIDTVSVTKEPAGKVPPIAAAPMRAKFGQPTDRPTSSPKPPSAEAVEKPVPVVCDQLVMRNGDLIDAKILEIGVNEIRYRRCHWKDGPEYVVSKSDVLSIRYANGDIDRFSWSVRTRSNGTV